MRRGGLDVLGIQVARGSQLAFAIVFAVRAAKRPLPRRLEMRLQRRGVGDQGCARRGMGDRAAIEFKRMRKPFDLAARKRDVAWERLVWYAFVVTKDALASLAEDPVLARLRSALAQVYGPRLERVVLFGSRARGEAHAKSDYDIAVFLNGTEGLWRESGRLAEIETDILLDTGAVVNALPFAASAFAESTPLMHELRRDGLEL